MTRTHPLIAASIPLLSLAIAQDFGPTLECPLLGPSFSSNFNLSETDAFAEAKAAFPGVIDDLFEAGRASANTSSFVIDVFSAVSNASLYTYSHEATAPAMNESFPPDLNDETIFRIGSVSKLFTVYAILAHAEGLDVLDHPVTQYLPELAGNAGKDPLNRIVYEDVTIGALASHQAGTGGFPLTTANCFATGDCDVEKFLTMMRDQKRASQPIFANSLYSDAGFGILGRVLERMTNQSYADALSSILSKPLDLQHSGTFIPKEEDVNGIVIPGVEDALSAWGLDNQVTAPSGGVYSNAADLRTLGLSILHNQLLTPPATREWMKPHARTSGLTVSIGAPWEIYSLTIPVSANSTRYRVSDLYSKAGGQPGYTAIFALSPDHQLGISVLVAGSSASKDRWTLRAAAAETFVTAAEHAAQEVAQRNFAGTFVNADESSSNATLTVDEGHPGLGLASWYVEGVEFRANLIMPGIELPPDTNITVRLYPTGLEAPSPERGNSNMLLKYRAVAQILPLDPAARAIAEGGKSTLFDDACDAFLNTAFFEDEQGDVVDEFVLEVDGEGRLVGLSHDATNQTLSRLEDS